MKKFTFLLLMTVMGILNANAQWTDQKDVNTLADNSLTNDTRAIATGNGGTYIAYYKKLLSFPNYELRVQYLNAAGEKQFGPEGILVNNTIPMSTYTFKWKVSIDKADNLYIAVTSTGAGNNGYVFKINTFGESLWAGGLNLGTGVLPTVLPLSNGEVIISWSPGAGKGKLQRFDSEGIPVWANPVDISPSADYANKTTVTDNMFEMANGDVTVAFHTRLSNGTGALLYAQRYNSTGTPQWAVPAQLSEKQTSYNNPYSSTRDGDVIYYGYTLITGTRFDSFAQRLNPDGTTPWGLNGIDFDTNATLFEMYTEIAFDHSSQYIWTTATYTGSAQGNAGQYIQKFDKVTGARQFTDHGKEVFAIDNNHLVNTGNLYLLNDQPMFLMEAGNTLNAVFLDNNGNFLLPNHYFSVATFNDTKLNIILHKPYDNHAVVTFTEQKTIDEDRIYAQRFSTVLDIPCTIAPASLADITSECALYENDLTAPVATDSCGNTVTPVTDAVFPITQGTTTITWTYTTTTGATATQTQTIIVNDTTAPTLVLQNSTVAVDENATVVLTASQFDNGSTDACANGTGSWTWSVTPATFTCADLGEQTVTITATDVNGNIATSTATVTITDPNNYCTTAGVGEFAQNKTVLYPNPTQNIFNISSSETIRFIVVYDLLGKVLFRTPVSAENAAIDATTWSSGVYNVTIEDANGGQQKLKLIKN
ncbi:T9SS type A sorting domain-containing protein [Flavobacterium hauense]